MLRVKIEVVPFGDESLTREISRFNIGLRPSSPLPLLGNYDVLWMRKGQDDEHFEIMAHERAKGAEELVRRVLEAAVMPETWDGAEE